MPSQMKMKKGKGKQNVKIAKDNLNCKKRSQVQLFALLWRAILSCRKAAAELSQSNFYFFYRNIFQ